jgi:diguanylate cyclase (GGDEF)-like protein
MLYENPPMPPRQPNPAATSRSALTRRYLAALIMVALCATAGHLAFSYLAAGSERDAAIINSSGRQRMLAQRLADSALVLHTDSAETGEAGRSLAEDLAELAYIHDRLLAFLRETGQDDLLAVYEAPPLDLTPRIHAFLDQGRRVLELRDRDAVGAMRRTVASLIADLDHAVAAQQAASERRARLLRRLDLGLLGVLLATLALAGLFIFRPMVAAVLREQERARRLNQDLERLAATDSLTQALNRVRFAETVARELEASRRHGQPLAAILFDIDHFKAVNDIHGHAAGDLVLAGLARLVQSQVRLNDSFFRWGGEEFLILAPHTDGPQALGLAEKLRRSAAGQEFPGGIRITLSFGVAAFGGQETGEYLVGRADAALYAAKHAGRNQSVLAEDSDGD